MADNPRFSRIYGAVQVCANPDDPTKTTGLLLPQLTTAQAEALVTKPLSVIQDGYIYYDTDKKGIRGYIDGKWEELYTAPAPQGQDLVIPNASQASEEGVFLKIKKLGSAHNYSGLLYYNTTGKDIRTFVDNTFATVMTTTTTATGTGLPAGHTPFSLPIGASNLVEQPSSGNQQDGFMYYDTDQSCIRNYINSEWKSIANIKIKDVNNDYDMTNVDHILGVNTATTPQPTHIHIALPPFGAVSFGRTFTIKDIGGQASAKDIVIESAEGSSHPIDNSDTYSINTNYGAITIFKGDTKWFIIAKV